MLTLENHPVLDEMREELNNIEEYATKYTLADAIREGSKHTEQLSGWYNEDSACAMSAAALAVKARKG